MKYGKSHVHPLSGRGCSSTLKEEFGYTNPMQIPTIKKIVVNIGVGEAIDEPKSLDGAVEDLRIITGQQPIVTRAKKSIATYKLREGRAIGAKVTLRREKYVVAV